MSDPDPTRRVSCAGFLAIVLTVGAPITPNAATAQTPDQSVRDTSRTVVVVPGPRYAAGGVKRLLLGSAYRDLWTTPITARVLDVGAFAGGLIPESKHVGSQTRSLRFLGGDGMEYVFRLVDKDPEVPPDLEGTVVAGVLQDVVHTTHPAAKLVAAGLLHAAHVLRTDPRLFVLPDSPLLGEFRAEFAGTLGILEERSNEGADGHPGFAGATQVIGSTRLFEHLDAGPKHRVDARALLTARLMDIYMGDRDRHRDQWRWARFGHDTPVLWQPISRDHDHAFEIINGLLVSFARSRVQEVLAFGPKIKDLDRLHWFAREMDRRFLVELDRPTWDSVASALQARLTDAAIDDAVRAMPPEMYAVGGAQLSSALRQRRDQLPEAASRFYEMLARQSRSTRPMPPRRR